jgi:hypothetical protein
LCAAVVLCVSLLALLCCVLAKYRLKPSKEGFALKEIPQDFISIEMSMASENAATEHPVPSASSLSGDLNRGACN